MSFPLPTTASLAVIALAIHALPAKAQQTSPSSSSTVLQINERLEAARKRVASGQSALVSAPDNSAALSAKAEDAKAREAKPIDTIELANEAESKRRMETAMNNLSPEGKLLLAQNTTPVPVAVPVEDAPVAKPGSPSATTVSVQASSAGPKPTPLKPTPLNPPAKASNETIIKADEMYFDGNGSIAVYVGNVDVRKPGLHITCDEFEVHMKKESKAKDKPVAKAGDKAAPNVAALANAPAKPSPAPAPAGKKASDDSNESNIETAIARGRMVIIEKKGDTGEVQIGQCKEATYEGATGNIYLRVWPQVQKGNNIITAAEETCVMTLTEAGDFNARGRTNSLLANQKDKDGKPLPATGGLSIPVPPPGQ